MTKALKTLKNKPIIPLGIFLAVTVVMIIVSFVALHIPIVAICAIESYSDLGSWYCCDCTDRSRDYFRKSCLYGIDGNYLCACCVFIISLDQRGSIIHETELPASSG